MKSETTGVNLKLFSLLCCLVYFTSYLTRINYAAILVEIISDLNTTNEIGSLAVTGAFITYGVGQLVSGILGDKISPRLLISGGLLCTAAVNLLMGFLHDIRIMTAIWCVNGFFQAMLWPPLVKVMAVNLKGKIYTNTVVLVSAASSAATIAVYLLSPLLIEKTDWRAVFFIAGTVAVFVSFIWYLGTIGARENVEKDENIEIRKVRIKDVASSGIVVIMMIIILQGILRDGITTWMPTYIKEVFEVGSSISILTTVVLPIFSIISVSVASRILLKVGDEIRTSSILFIVALIASSIMPSVFSRSVIICAFLMALITGCMHGINLMLISRLPIQYKKYGKISTISGVLNSCTYIGSAISTYGFAVLADRFGWEFIIVLWIVICVLGTILSLLNIKRFDAFRKDS